MALNTKIDLSNNKVYQGSGQTLTLSGHTIIATSGNMKYSAQRTFTGGTEVVDKQYVDTAVVSGVTGGTVYNLLSPAAVTVGGITAGVYVLTGKSTNCIIQDMLYPELCGTLTAPSTSIGLSTTGTLEIGTVIATQTVTGSFSRGSISPQYCSTSAFRSGCANAYCFTGAQMPAGLQACNGASANNAATSYVVVAGANTWGVCTRYDCGVQPKSNKNNNFSSPLVSGCTTAASTSVTGILPYFYGVSTGAPVPGSALLATGSKVVATSTGQININFGTNTGKYLWFATPNASTTKLGWYEGPTNKGNIGAVTDLFNAPATPSVDSPSSCWTGEVYKIYSSNYSTDTAGTTYCMTNTTQQ